MKSLCDSLESVQYFALKIISKSWSQDYESLLDQLKLPTLTHAQMEKSQNYYRDIFKIKHKLTHYIHFSFVNSPTPSYQILNKIMLLPTQLCPYLLSNHLIL